MISEAVVEKVARALAVSRGLNPDVASPEPGAPKVWECHAHHARAAIDALVGTISAAVQAVRNRLFDLYERDPAQFAAIASEGRH